MPRTHKLPVFPSSCIIWRGGGPTTGGTIVYNGKAEKVVWARGGLFLVGFAHSSASTPMAAVYLPAGTDVRGELSSTGSDIIQWTANQLWLYVVTHVDDVADGFSNKFRVAWVNPLSQPTPLP